ISVLRQGPDLFLRILNISHKFSALTLLAATLALAASSVSCGDDTVVQGVSLQGPRAFALARGPLCLQDAPGDRMVEIVACADGARGAIGLVANQNGDSISVVDMKQPSTTDLPKFVD